MVIGGRAKVGEILESEKNYTLSEVLQEVAM